MSHCRIYHYRIAIGLGLTGCLLLTNAIAAKALPPPDEIPEEVLRNQTSLSGRSPVDNSELSPSEYANLQTQLQEAQRVDPRVSPKLQRLIVLLKLRKLLRSMTPF
jgi:hypothetical protein